MAAMIRAQQEKAKPQAQPPTLEERASGKPAGRVQRHHPDAQACTGSHHLCGNSWRIHIFCTPLAPYSTVFEMRITFVISDFQQRSKLISQQSH